MRRAFLILILLAIGIPWISNSASGQQAVTSEVRSTEVRMENPPALTHSQDCGSLPNRLTTSSNDYAGTLGSNTSRNLSGPEVAGCSTPQNNLGDPRSFQTGCGFEQVLNFQMAHPGEPEIEIPIWR